MRAGPTRNSPLRSVTRCRPMNPSTAPTSGTTSTYGSQARIPGYPMCTSAASRRATPTPSGHHHHGTARRSSKVGPASGGRRSGGRRSGTGPRVVSPPVCPEGIDAEPIVPVAVEVLLTRLDPEVPVPGYAYLGDAGADLVTTRDLVLGPGRR